MVGIVKVHDLYALKADLQNHDSMMKQCYGSQTWRNGTQRHPRKVAYNALLNGLSHQLMHRSPSVNASITINHTQLIYVYIWEACLSHLHNWFFDWSQFEVWGVILNRLIFDRDSWTVYSSHSFYQDTIAIVLKSVSKIHMDCDSSLHKTRRVLWIVEVEYYQMWPDLQKPGIIA